MATDTARFTSRRSFEPAALARVLPPWWLMLIAGVGWILVSVIVLQFDYTCPWADDLES